MAPEDIIYRPIGTGRIKSGLKFILFIIFCGFLISVTYALSAYVSPGASGFPSNAVTV